MRRVFALMTLAMLFLGCGGEDRPNILLITLDTTRRDRLGVYEDGVDTSPNLDALARESVVYTEATSTSSWTLPAHASLFSGRYATSHGAQFDPDGPMVLTNAIQGPENWNQYRANGLHPQTPTLAGVLCDEGYATGAVVAGPWLKKVFGLDCGFEMFDDEDISTVAGRLADDVTDRALSWIEDNSGRPQFLFLNYFDPHKPYTPPAEYARKHVPEAVMSDPGQETLRDNRLYDAEIEYMDHHLGRLMAGLKEMDLYDKTWIIITADHGELLGEDGKWGHGHYLTEEEVRIPLIIKYPRDEVAPGRDSTRVSLVDIMPLVLERLGLELPGDVQGASNLAHPMLAEVFPLEQHSPHGSWRALYEGDYKFVWNSLGNHALYNVAEDPTEDLNLLDPMNTRATAMNQSLDDYLNTLPLPAEPDQELLQVDEETQEMLRSLGYMN